tara:strand:+ start:194 stop:340 length:147 start_codon:yes stop_codon:yes gene_type:complete
MSKSGDLAVFLDEHYPDRWVAGVEEVTMDMYNAYVLSLTKPELVEEAE